MSRNFELLTSLGANPLPAAAAPAGEPAAEPAAEPVVIHTMHPATHSFVSPMGATREEIQLVQRIFVAPGAEAPRSVVFCGISEDGECARVFASIGEILAADPSRRVCLADANVHSPSLESRYGIHAELDFADAILGAGPVKGFAQRVGETNVWLIPSRKETERRLRLWSPQRLTERFAELRDEFDFVLTCAPAVHAHPEAVALGRVSDGVVLVLEENFTRRDEALRAKETLEASSVCLLGVVLAHHTSPTPGVLGGIL